MSDEKLIEGALERRLRRWMSEQAAGASDAPLLAAVAATTRDVPQDRGIRAWLGRSTRPARTGRGPRGALVLAALFTTAGVAMLVGAGSRPSEPPIGDWDIYPRLPTALPDGAESGTHETPLGPARWVHLVGDLDSWPVDLDPVPGPTGGLLAFDLGDSFPDCDASIEECQPPGLWSSDDGITWTRRPPPVADADALDFVAGSYWITTSADTLWRSDDAVEWTQVDLSALEPPEPADLDWSMDIDPPPVASGRTTIVPIGWRVADTNRLLGLADDDGLSWLEAGGPGRFTIWNWDGPGRIGAIRVEETAAGLRILDTKTGRPISEVDGVGMDFMHRWVANAGIVAQQIAVIEDGVAMPVSLPGPPLFLPEQGFLAFHLFGGPDAFVAFNPTPDGRYRTWTSVEGRTWSEPSLLRIGGVAAQDLDLRLESDVGERPAVVASGEGGVWETFDGKTWQPAELDPDNNRASRVPAGWLSTAYGRFEVRALDGEWVPVADGIYRRYSSDEGRDGRIGDTWFLNKLSLVDDAPRQDLWIVQFEGDRAD